MRCSGMFRAATWIVGFTGLMLALTGGSQHAFGMNQPFSSCFWVDPINGVDIGNTAGTQGSPFKSITHALTLIYPASQIQCVHPLPGTYTIANGEQFPLVLPAFDQILGDEPTKGSTTVIQGMGPRLIGNTQYGVTLVANGYTMVAGVRIVGSTKDTMMQILIDIPPNQNAVSIHDNTLTNANNYLASVAINLEPDSSDNAIVANVIKNNSYGIISRASGDGASIDTVVQLNAITNNWIGVSITAASAMDFGGGTVNGLGENTIACNQLVGIWYTPTTVTSDGVHGGDQSFLRAEHNTWNTVPPLKEFYPLLSGYPNPGFDVSANVMANQLSSLIDTADASQIKSCP